MPSPNVILPTAYVPESYWPAGYWPSQFALLARLPRGDGDVYDAILAALRATRRFEKVIRAKDEEVDQLVSEVRRLALLVPGTDERMTPEASPRRLLRVVRYKLVLSLHNDRDAATASRELDRLVAAVRNALDSVEYTDYCLFEHCFLERGQTTYSDPPVFVVGLAGRFGYVVDTSIGMKDTA